MFVVAGVTGHVGAVVARELLGKKQKVKVYVRDPQKGAAFSKLGAEVAVGKLEDNAALGAALKGATGFFTLLPGDFGAPDFYAAQCKTADAITAAVKSSGVPHVVILSSVGADLPEGTGPIRGLYYLENALRAAGTRLTAIRAGYFQENLGQALVPARQMGVFLNFTPSADIAMPMIATRDIGMLAAESMLEKPAKNQVLDLHGPAYSNRQLAEKLGAALGKTLNIVDVPEAEWVPTLLKSGMPKHIAEVFAEMYRGFGSGRIVPKGDRMVAGKTGIDEVIKDLVRA
jgi:uncharacterized protein YbjT (DUF2867 family)